MLPYKDISKVRITQPYGVKNPRQNYAAGVHSGLDMVSDGDKTIIAIGAGKVIRSQNTGSWGSHVVIKQDDGLYGVYAHLAQRVVNIGNTVRAGTMIGIEGMSGNSTASHLHIELQKSYYDPFSHTDISAYLGIKNEVGSVQLIDDMFADDKAWVMTKGISDGSDQDRPVLRKEIWAMLRRYDEQKEG